MQSLVQLSDWEFDQFFFDEKMRNLSEVHWTPVQVAKRAAELLCIKPKSKVLDVGSGIGKFCLVGALSTDATFTGIERRQALVEASQAVISRTEIPRVTIIHGEATDLDWSEFDGFYLYNPFYENVVDTVRFEPLVALSLDRFEQYVRMTREKLRNLKPGTRIVTYHGFGGVPPLGYQLVLEDRFKGGPLQLWVKQLAPGGAFS